MSKPLPQGWIDGQLPPNVRVGQSSVICGQWAFKRFLSKTIDALSIGDHCTMDGTQFALGAGGRVRIGDYCFFTNVVLLCEMELVIGNYVMIGWNTAISDSDFHPVDPALRIEDAIACSPLGKGRPRPAIACKPVIIEDDVWIGPSCTILKGVRIGRGAFIEPGSVITRDVPAGARVMGNPAQVVEG